MQMNGSERIQASKEAVWAALDDVEVLKQCIPGCESLEKISRNGNDGKGCPQGRADQGELCRQGDTNRSRSAKRVSYFGRGGSGGVAGFAKGGASVRLESRVKASPC